MPDYFTEHKKWVGIETSDYVSNTQPVTLQQMCFFVNFLKDTLNLNSCG